MWFCFVISLLYFVLWIAAKSAGNSADADYAATLGAIWVVGTIVISEIRKGRKS